MSVAVQIESAPIPAKSEHNPAGEPVLGVCGTCTRCGATCALPIDTRVRGGPVTRRKEAVARVLKALTNECPHPLPWGLPPVHEDRRIPKGVSLYVEEVGTGGLYPLAVDAKGKLSTSVMGCAWGAAVLVVPESDSYSMAAADFAAELVERGYVRAACASLASVADRLKKLQGAK